MSKYLLVLGAPDGASNASFQPIADAMAKGFGEQVPFVVWTDSQLASVKGPSELVAVFGAPLVYGKDQLLLYVVAGDDTKPSMGQGAADLLLTTEFSPLVNGVMYVYDRTGGPTVPPASTINLTRTAPPPIWAFQAAADNNPSKLHLTFVEVSNTPAGTVTEGPANGMLFASGPGTTAVSISAADVVAGRLGTIYNLAEQMALLLRGGSSGGSGGGGGPLIEPKPAAKPAAKTASLFSSPVVLIGALGVSAYFLFFRKKRGHKGSSSRRS